MESDTNNTDGSVRQFMDRVKLAGVPDAISGLQYSIRDIDARSVDIVLSGAQVKALFAEMYPTAILFDPQIKTMPAIYTNIRDCLNERGPTSRSTLLDV